MPNKYSKIKLTKAGFMSHKERFYTNDQEEVQAYLGPGYYD